jgi:predicted small lipoprotein YifL
MRPIYLRLPAALAVALTLAGCGLTDPYTSQHPPTTSISTSTTTTSTTATATNADPGPERGGTIPNAAQAAQNNPAAGAGRPTPQAALERYANLDINWTAHTVAGIQDQLAAISVGEARAQALQAAASYGHDRTLQASQVANTGTVIAIAPGQGSAAGLWVIVTRESTTGEGDYAGLPPTDHVTDAQVEHTQHGFVVSAWSPQS